ncbi:putative transmembrane protein [Mycobacteroides abscessus subsp. abscessus]|nr:putative transmembrane protein [Mycobacteroides abscessus subsp. abscessus]
MSKSDVSDPTSSRHSTTFPLAAAALCDAVAVVVFVLIGRANHHDGFALIGVLQTLWPFLVATAAGWSIAYVYAHVRSSEWFGSDFVAIGMVLRYLLHQGVALSFIIVATIALGLFMLGWRAVVAYAMRKYF